jgi:quercetin dioxygenase-like cupin family protein
MLAAASSGEVEITAEPHHHLVLKNEFVRVFQVEVPPHQATLMHRHRYDYVYVTIGAAEISNEPQGKPPATIKLQDGETRFLAGNFSHIARDVASTPFRNVTVEFLQDKKGASAPKWREDRGLQILQGGTADILAVKDGVRITDFQLQPGASIPSHELAGPFLLVAVNDLDLRTQEKDRAGHLKPGSVKWFPSGYKKTFSNAAKQTAHFVTLEFR